MVLPQPISKLYVESIEARDIARFCQ